MEKAKRKSLSRKTVRGILLFAVLIVITVSTSVCYGVLVLQKREFNEDTIRYAKLIAEAIDGDKAKEYVDTGKKDEYYLETQQFLRSICDESEILSCQVYVRVGDELVYAWDVKDEGTSKKIGQDADLGQTKPFYEEVLSKDPPEHVLNIKRPEGDLCTAFSPIYDSEGEPVAISSVDRLNPGIRTILAQFFLLIVIIAGIISAIMVILAYVIMRRNLIEPIRTLTENAEKMVGRLEREEAIKIDIHTNDELQTLGEAFMKMDMDLRQYIDELAEITAERHKMDTELDLASRIQLGMLPSLVPPYTEDERFELYASTSTAKAVGGDFYDFFMIDDKHIALLIADVSGKGVPAAFFMSVSKILIKESVKHGMGPAEALSYVNERFQDNNDLEFFVTVWLVIIDLETGKGVASNAGHEHPALKRADGIFELVKYNHSLPVAAMKGIRFEEHEFDLNPGDMLFVYTDGVTEAIDGENRFFGTDRLLEVLNSNTDASVKEVLENVSRAIDEYSADAEQYDDETMLGFRYNGSN